MYKPQNDLRSSRLSRTLAVSCVLGILLLAGGVSVFGAGPLQHQSYRLAKETAFSLKNRASQLRSEALERIRKATFQDLTAAVRQLQQSARLFRIAGQSSAAAADYLSIGEIYFTWSKYKRALTIYRFALSLSKKDDYDLKCSILSRMAITYTTFGDLKHSLQYAEQAGEMAHRTTGSLARAEAAEALGMARLYSTDPRQALDLFRAAGEIYKATGNLDAQATASRDTGWALASIGLSTEALSEQNNALRLWMSAGNRHGVAQAHVALGVLWGYVGEPDKAFIEYHQARPIFHDLGDRDNEAIVLNGLGTVSNRLGNYENALQYFTEARSIFAALGDEFGEIGAIDGAAISYWHLRKYRDARSLYRIKLARAQRAHQHREQVSAIADLADMYELEHEYKQARALYIQSLALCHALRHVFGEIRVLIQLGHLYTETGHYEEAARSFRRAVKFAESNREAPMEAEAHHELAIAYRALHQNDKAKTESEAALQIIESERTKVSDFDSRATYFASVHAYYQLYIDILMQLDQQHPDQGYAQHAFEAAEKSKVRSLLDMLASSAAEKQCPAATAAQAENARVAQPPGSPTRADVAREGVAVRAGVARDGVEVPSAVESSYTEPSTQKEPGVDQCIAPAPSALTLEQVQAEIRGDNAVLLEYALAPGASYVWVVDEGHISSFRLPGEKQISELARKYRSAITDHQPVLGEDAGHQAQRVVQADRDLEHLSQELSQVLLDPVAHLLTGKSLIVVPDGLLRYVPFAALQLPSGTREKPTQTLAEKFEIVTLPSASTLEILREASAKRPAPTRLAKVFADPVFEPDDPRLAKRSLIKTPRRPTATLVAALRDVPVGVSRIPRLEATGPEADAIQEALSGKADVARDFAASRDAVLSGDLAQYRYIHFATHGLLDSKHPEFSGLILSLVNQNGAPEEGYVRVRDIYALKLSADLVVLSSCNSALGKDVESEGIIGLTRAFLFAGSTRVISSLWKVDDRATKELMTLFYSELHAGKSPAAALRSAQSTLARDPYWKSPYYWAAFILQGEYK